MARMRCVQVVQRQPGPTLVPPLLVLVVLMVLGVTGTLLGASAAVGSQKDIALSISLDTAVSFKLSVEQVGPWRVHGERVLATAWLDAAPRNHPSMMWAGHATLQAHT